MNKRCQVFTPPNIVIELLDRVGYSTNLYGSKVIENACGDGNILKVIVQRYIEDCINNNLSLKDIKMGLERDIYGAEIDQEHHSECLKNLDKVASKYNIYNVSWKILNVDILKTELEIEFDYVVGNPPYIKYKDLDLETRLFIKENYDSCCRGKFDYCYAFIEESLKSLSNTGKMSYLVPSNIFKNVFAQNLRDMMLPWLTQIYDYTTEKIFEKKLTSSTIIVFDKIRNTDKIEYYDIVNNNLHEIKKKNLNGKWTFLQNKKRKFAKNQIFSNYFTASVSVATLLNEAFVISDFEENEEFIIVDNLMIEKEVIRKAASPRSLNYGKEELIIFPYHYKNNTLVRYTPEVFKNKFPKAVNYLKKFKEKINKRKSDNNVQWYEYGRSQALAHLNQEKLLTSTVITKRAKIHKLSKECIPYSGIYITSKGKLPLDKAKQILESPSFYKYVKVIGINASGSSMRITANDINNYEFVEQEVL